jgi:flagellar basal-body rod modification protein FlgD
MDARLTQEMLAQRTAASHVVAGALAPKSTTSTFKSAASAAATGTSSTSATDTSTITSSDFLTLLVSELKNQDPTQPTDPNAYITQLAQVNSLEQLIQINSGISQLDSSVPTTGSSTTSSSATGSSVSGSSHAASLQPASAAAVNSQIHKQVPGAAVQ